jgi:hypothetical protein
MFFPDPDRVKPQLLGGDHEVQGVLVVGNLVLTIREKVKECKHTELHKRSSFHKRIKGGWSGCSPNSMRPADSY